MNILSLIFAFAAPQQPAVREDDVLAGLRRGDEALFVQMVDAYSGSLLRLAMAYVPSRAVAEEVVQETWMGVLEGIARFEGRSSFKTWLFTILTNRAKTRGQRERRYTPLTLPTQGDGEDGDQEMDAELFMQSGNRAGHWVEPPHAWDYGTPERAALSKEIRQQIDMAIARLPETQRRVIILRDLEELTAQEACNIMNVSETNQRVLLHRARTAVRRHLAAYLGTSPTGGA